MSYSVAEMDNRTEGLTGRALAGTGWSTIATVGKQVLTLASVMTVARILGPNAYGLMGMAVIVTAFISNFRDLGTASAIIQRPAISNKLLSSLFWVNVAVGLSLCTLVWIAAPMAASFFHAAEVTPVLRTLSVSMLIASCGVVHNAILSRGMLFKAIAVTDLGAAFAAYAVALCSALAGLGVWSLVFASLAGSFVSTLGYVVAGRFRPKWEFDWTEVRSVARYSSNLSAFGIVNYGYRNADNLIVGRVLGTVPLGYYNMAYNLMLTPISNVSSVVAQVLLPAFSRIQGDDERFRSAFVRATMLTGLITFPMMAGLGVTAAPLIKAVLGAKWIGAIVPFQILAVVGLVQSVHTMTGIIFQAKGRTDWLFRWSLVVLVLTVSAFLVGVHFGITGVAAAYAIVFLVFLTIPGFAIAFRLIGLRITVFGRAVLPQLIITAGMVVACIGWQMALSSLGQRNPWVELVSTSVIGAGVYALGLMVLRPRVLLYVDEILNSSDMPLAKLALRWLRRCRFLPSIDPGAAAAPTVY